MSILNMADFTQKLNATKPPATVASSSGLLGAPTVKPVSSLLTNTQKAPMVTNYNPAPKVTPNSPTTTSYTTIPGTSIQVPGQLITVPGSMKPSQLSNQAPYIPGYTPPAGTTMAPAPTGNSPVTPYVKPPTEDTMFQPTPNFPTSTTNADGSITRADGSVTTPGGIVIKPAPTQAPTQTVTPTTGGGGGVVSEGIGAGGAYSPAPAQPQVDPMLQQIYDAIAQMTSGYQGKLSAIGDQMNNLSIEDYIAQAWNSLQPMYAQGQQTLQGQAQLNSQNMAASQEARGLGYSNLNQASELANQKVLQGGLGNLFAQFNEQALGQGQNMYNMERSRLGDMLNLATADYQAGFQGLNSTLDAYYKDRTFTMEQSKFMEDIKQNDWYRQFQESDAQRSQANIEADRAMKQQDQEFDQAYKQWSMEFQERNAARVASNSPTAPKKEAWQTGDYYDYMVASRAAIIEGIYDPEMSPSEIRSWYNQAITEFPELARDTGLLQAVNDMLSTAPQPKSSVPGMQPRPADAPPPLGLMMAIPGLMGGSTTPTQQQPAPTNPRDIGIVPGRFW